METIISKRIPYSKIRKMVDAASKLESEGKKLIHLEIGRPDFNTPDNIVNAAITALKKGKVHYCANAGVPELRKAISDKYAKRYGLHYDFATQILVTNGVAEGIYLAVSALLNPGDQILIPDPTWINYEVVPLMNLVDPVKYSLKAENGFQPDLAEIEDKITSRTKMIALVNPSNPTGMVITKEMLEKIAALAKKYDLIVLADEIYEDIVYAPAKFYPMACVDDMKERTVVMNGFSKSYSMTGWRLGYILAPAEMANAMLRAHQYTLTSTNTFAQWGAIEALEGPQDALQSMLAQFEKRKDFVYESVQKIPGLSCAKPEGAFYLFVSVKGLNLDGFEASDILLNDYGIVTVPGESFGKEGNGYIRLSYASSMENLIVAVEQLKAFATTKLKG